MAGMARPTFCPAYACCPSTINYNKSTSLKYRKVAPKIIFHRAGTRRDLTIDETGTGRGNKWKQAAISLETKASLKDQPRGTQLEYRVRAINKSGQSEPSNTIAVVL